MSLGFDMAYSLGALLSSPIWGWKMLRSGKWRTDWAGRFGRVDEAVADAGKPRSGRAAPTVLIHAVSVGEVNAIRLLVRRLREQTAGRWRIIVSSTTNTGVARARSLFEPALQVVRYPFDFSLCVSKFLDGVRPELVVLVELEVWPNFVEACHKRKIPVCVVNGRLSERSFRGYRLASSLLRSTFGRLDLAAVQTREYAERFEQMGTPQGHIVVTDSMKWDTAQIAEPSEVKGVAEFTAAMGLDSSRPLVVAGSTGPGEEAMLIKQCPPGVQLLIAPRKPERFAEARRAFGPNRTVVCRTDHPDGTQREVDPAVQFFLLDTLGELRKAYALADVALVGRSFLGMYGSDPIEPIALGKPTIIGPHHGDFKEIVDALHDGDGIEISRHPFDAAMNVLVDASRAVDLAERGRAVIRKHQGATDRHVEIILEQVARTRRRDWV